MLLQGHPFHVQDSITSFFEYALTDTVPSGGAVQGRSTAGWAVVVLRTGLSRLAQRTVEACWARVANAVAALKAAQAANAIADLIDTSIGEERKNCLCHWISDERESTGHRRILQLYAKEWR